MDTILSGINKLNLKDKITLRKLVSKIKALITKIEGAENADEFSLLKEGFLEISFYLSNPEKILDVEIAGRNLAKVIAPYESALQKIKTILDNYSGPINDEQITPKELFKLPQNLLALLKEEPFCTLLSEEDVNFQYLIKQPVEKLNIVIKSNYLSDWRNCNLIFESLMSLSANELTKVGEYNISVALDERGYKFDDLIALYRQDARHLQYLTLDDDDLYDAVLEQAPDVDNLLLEYAREYYIDLSEIMAQLCESDQAHFRSRLEEENYEEELQEDSDEDLYDYEEYGRQIEKDKALDKERLEYSLRNLHLSSKELHIHGLNFSSEFKFVFVAKNANKICDVSYLEELHKAAALTERLKDAKLSRKGIRQHGGQRYNLLLGSIGFIITNIPHRPEGAHKRVFKNILIKIDGEKIHRATPHTERTIFDYLLKNIEKIIRSFKEKHEIGDGNKIYAVFLDLHSSYDMCQTCFSATPPFLKAIRSTLLDVLPQVGFKLPKEKPDVAYAENKKQGSFFDIGESGDHKRFQVILNFSSQCDHSGGIRHVRQQQPVVGVDIDLRHSDRLLFFHGTNKWHNLWTRNEPRENTAPLKECTLFATQGARQG